MFSHLTLFSSLAYFFVTFLDNQLWKYILKPTTTILIIGVALESGKNKSQAKTLGLIFSLIGDIFLMFQGELYFIFGLASFLIAHVFYISVFYQTKKYNNGPKSMLTLGSIAVTYFFYLHEAIYNDGGAVMLFAVLVYIVVIATMVYYAYLNDNAMLSLGVTLFFISDATIAFDKFIVNAPGESQWEYVVMVTYYIAQYLIASF